MLKLEKASTHREISVIFRSKEYFFTSSLLMALVIAVGFHLGFLLIFHIAPIKLRWENTILSPVQVEAQTAFKELVAIADIDSSDISTRLPPPQFSSPTLPENPPVAAMQPIEYIEENLGFLNPFAEIERHVYQPIFVPTVQKLSPPLEIVISGPLGSLPLLSKEVKQMPIPALPKKEKGFDHRLVYTVVTDGHTGRICWFESKELATSGILNRFGEELLRQMAFKVDAATFMIHGEVEIHLRGKAP